MDRQRYWLGLAAGNLVRQMPLSVVASFAEAILDRPREDRFTTLSALPNPDFRDVGSRFLHVLAEKAPDLSSEAISAAILGASHVQAYRAAYERVEGVWTGPETDATPFRHTEPAILEVVDSARDRLTVVSYAVYRIPRIRDALVAAARRGVRIRLIVETPNRIEGQGEYDSLLALGDNVAAACSIYYWPQENRPKDENGKIGILHVKCAVADGRILFLSSANLTEYAFTINMELGLLVTGGKLPGEAEAHFERMIDAGILRPL